MERGWQRVSSGKEELTQAGETAGESLQVLGWKSVMNSNRKVRLVTFGSGLSQREDSAKPVRGKA